MQKKPAKVTRKVIQPPRNGRLTTVYKKNKFTPVDTKQWQIKGEYTRGAT